MKSTPELDSIYLEKLTPLLSDESIVQRLVKEVNDHAPHFRIDSIAEIINSNHEQSFEYIAMLSSIVHMHMSHNSDFEEKLTTTLSPIQDKLSSFISLLNENGKKGLQLNFLAENYLQQEPHGIQSIDDELFLKIIYDDEKPIGMTPLLKLKIIQNNNQINQPSDYFLCSIHTLKGLSNAFGKLYHETITQLKEYDNQLDGKMVLYDD